MSCYPKGCRKAIHVLMDEIGVDSEIAFKMILFTAAMMDLQPEDEQVMHIILQDCGVEIE